MMRKLFSVLLAAMLVFGLTACGATGTTYHAGDNDILGDESVVDDAGDALFGGDNTDGVKDNSGGATDGANNGGNTSRSADGGNNTNGYNTGGNSNTGKSNNSSNNNGKSSNGKNGGKNSIGNNSGGNNRGNDKGASAYDSLNPANGTAQTGVSYDHMVDNGRVHDIDGDLTDGENSHWTE